MKKILIFFIFVYYFSTLLNGKTIFKADSLRIIGMLYDSEYQIPISRHMFLDDINESKRLRKEIIKEMEGKSMTYSDSVVLLSVAYVDTLITSEDKISSIITELNKLKKGQKLPINTNQDLTEAYFVHDQTRIIWSPLVSLDNRLLIVLYQKNKVNFIWLDAYMAEIGNKRYQLTNEAKSVLSQYTHIYDSFLRNREGLRSRVR